MRMRITRMRMKEKMISEQGHLDCDDYGVEW